MNYFPKMIEAMLRARGRADLQHVVIEHDRWCNLLSGKGQCNCNPSVSEPITDSDWKRQN